LTPATAVEETRRWPLALALVLFFAAWLACCWPWLSGAVTIPWDAKAHFQPQLQFLARALHAGESPFWTPNVFSGSPQIADPQSLIFSPPFLLLALWSAAPSLREMDAATFGALLAGGVFIILFFRDRGWHWGGAVLAALIFSFGGSAAWRVQHIGQILSLASLPIALFLLDRALRRSSLLYGALAGLAAAILVLGRDQVSLLGVYTLAAWLVAHWLSGDRVLPTMRASLPPLLAGAVVGAVATLPPVTLTWLLAEQSNRPEIDFIGAGRGSLHPALLITSIIPHLFGAAYEMEKYWGPPSFAWSDTGLFLAQNMGVLYVGAAPIVLFLLAGVLRGALWAREIRFFAVALAIALLYALGWYTPVFRAIYDVVPGVSFYRRPADATFLIGYFLAICAGWLAHRLLTHAGAVRWRWFDAALVAAPFLAALFLGLRIDRLGMTPVPLVWAAISFAAGIAALALAARWTAAGRATLAALLLIGVTTVDLAFNNGPNGANALPPQTYDVLRPDTKNETIAFLKRKTAETASADRRDRIELAALGFHWPNASLVHGLENTLGYNPVRLGLYTRATGAGDHVALADQRNFSALAPSYRSLLYDMLGLRFIATGVPIEQIDRTLKPGEWAPVARTPDGFIYENPNALPRVLLVTEARPADFDQLLKDGGWPPGFDPRRTVLLANAVATPATPRRAGSARIDSYRNTEIAITVDAPDGGWLALNDPWMPWWRAAVDGADATVLQANVLFRAVAIPPGRHSIVFRFRPFLGAWDAVKTHFADRLRRGA